MLSRDSLGESVGSEEKEKKEAKDSLDMRDDNMIRGRVATKNFEDFGEVLCKEYIAGRKPVSIIHYTWPGTCINRPLN